MSPARHETRLVAYRDARLRLDSGDIVLFRARPWSWRPSAWKSFLFGSLITWLGRSDYSHAGMLVACRGEFFVAEMIEGTGGRLWPLSKYAQTHSGDIDVFRIRPFARKPGEPPYDPGKAADAMMRFVGEPYGWWALLKAFALHLPVVRHAAKGITEERPWKGPLYCSAAVAWAMECGGDDPVGDLPPEHTEPGDLARSPLVSRGYLFTICAADCDSAGGDDARAATPAAGLSPASRDCRSPHQEP